MMIVVTNDATWAYGTDKISSGLQAWIGGHHIRTLWETHEYDKDSSEILLIDAQNTFNEENKKIMIVLAARHE